MPALKGISECVKGQVFALTDGETTMGRHTGNDLKLEDLSVSSFHCCVVVDGATCTVRDLGSTNGTRVNGQAVAVRALSPGDVLQVGSVELAFEDENAPAQEIPAATVPANKIATSPSAGVNTTRLTGFKRRSGLRERNMWIIIGIVAALAVIGTVVLVVVLANM